MGFHVMPHFNSVDMDPSNPVYSRVRDFQYRAIENMKILGWSWVDGEVLGVPESDTSLLEHRDKKVTVKIPTRRLSASSTRRQVSDRACG